MKQLSILCCLLFSLTIFAQEIKLDPADFRLTGDAVRAGTHCYRLTSDNIWQGGTVWYKKPVNLNQPFVMEMNLKLGCRDGGADGMVFIFHDRLRTGFQGEGMGFGGLYPSLGIEMDTYENFHLADPAYDHIAIMKHGRMHHRTGVTRPVPILANRGNIEDCKVHAVRIDWSPDLKQLKIMVDGKVRIERKLDIVKDIFSNNPNVYWGFSAATGGSRNLHEACLEKTEFTEVSAFDPNIRAKLLRGKTYSLQEMDFLSGKTTLPPTADEELEKLVQLLRNNKNLEIYIQGHTDSSGNASNNKRLSQLRADEVAKYLREHGIDKKRIHSSGHGEAFPKTKNNTAEGRKINRRVDVVLIDPRA